MKPKSTSRRLLSALALVSACLAADGFCAEPVDQFVQALRERKYYDEAIDYLALLQVHEQLPGIVKQRVPYEQAETLLEQAGGESDLTVRGTQLSRAAELFETFRGSFPDHELAGRAATHIANILIERGQFVVQSSLDPDNQEATRARAREYFEQARQQLTAADRKFQADLQKMPKLVAPTEQDLQNRKRRLAGDLAQARLLSASIDFELAKTFEAGSAPAKKHLQAAAHNYSSLYESYRTRSVGLLARWWEGRCYQELGQFKQALGCYRELIELPATAETRAIKTRSTLGALECLTNDSQKKYQEAIEYGERWEKELGSNQADAYGLAIRYRTALAYQAQSKALPIKDPNRKKLAGFARQFVVPVAQHPGEYQRSAKMLLVALGGNKDPKDARGRDVTFAEAYEQGRQALERMQEVAANLAIAQRGKDRDAIETLEKQKSESTAAALESLRLALNKSDQKTPIEDLNSVRYYLCFLAWDAGQFHDAAVLGEFLARRYGDSLPGRQGARIALAAWVRLYSDSKAADKDFERAQIQHIAEMIFKRWPDKEESDEAALTMLNFAVAERHFDKALDYLDKISTTSPRRGQAELRAGQALWSAYLRSLQAPAGERPSDEDANQLKQHAQEILSQGVARMDKAGPVDSTLAAGVLALAQICVETDQPQQAIAWLENPKLGPLTLVKAGNPAAARDAFATETYKLALRAYIGVHPQQLKKAEEAMDAVEKLVQKSGDAAASANLTAIYISLGRELEQHLRELRNSGKTKELESVSKAFEVFLDRITKREGGGSYASLNWVGETYYGLGSGFDEGGGPLSLKAKEYFQKAATAYERMLEAAQKDPKYKDQPDSLVGVRLRLADCQGRAGNFDAALKTLVAILKEKSVRLNAQVQAAQLHQARGATDPKGYAEAITGSSPGRDGKNVVWGWAKISQMTVNRPEFEETFHQARLSMAEARYKYALTQEDEAKRKKILEAAKQDLWMTFKLRPNLGGEETSARYDQMLKQIQKSLGDKEAGLVEFKERDVAAPGT
jgi:tetratricopeptide (TPR) repeat protein